MKHRETSFSLIFVAVILAHLGLIGWLFLGPGGCQQDLTASQSLTPEDKPPIQLNLSLSDRLAAKSDATEPEPSLPPRRAQVFEDPESRLVLPKGPVVKVPPPEPIVVDDTAEKEREAAKQKALLAEQQRRAEEAEAKLAQLEKEKQREAAVTRKRKLAATERVKREVAEKERLQNEAVAKATAKRETDRQEKLLAQQRQTKAAADALKRKEVEAELEREMIRQREAQKLAEAERERQAVAAAKQRELANRLEAARKSEEARILAERLERERAEATQIERAKVVGQPAVVKAKPIIGEAGGTGQQDIVPAKPTGGSGRPAPVKVDMAGYRVSVEKMIRNRWTVPKGIAVDRRPEVILRINRAGKVVYSRLSQKSGNPNLDRSAINAVRIGSRLIPLPPGYSENLYEVKVKFEID